ncbi:MAG: hypothetical protein KAR47_18005, partial [Planctomycetes bacterium]|nr:hypothetical protein [Planctomycetota bacterium]
NSTLVSSLDASVRITDVASGYAAIDLDGLSEYFWCVAAVNVAAAENTPSAVWSFTTAYNIVTSNFGSAADDSVTAGDPDAVTTGPASWAINGSFGFNEFILDAGTDAGYYVDTRDIAPTIGDNVALTMDSALDFTLSEKTVAFDLTHARTAEAGLKILTVEGLDSSSNRVFAIEVDCSRLTITPSYWDGSALHSYTGVTLDRGPQAGAAYDHSLMTTFQITLDGTDVTYVADGQTVTGTTTSTDFKTLKFKFDTISTYSGFWVDNILVYGLAGDSTPPAACAGLIAAAGNASVSLDWADNGEPDLASYTVYRSTTSGSGYASIAAEVADSDYADDTAANCTTYYYAVKAVDTNSNESAYGNEDSATPYISLLDLNSDCEVDLEDLAMLSNSWLDQYFLDDLQTLAEDWL